MALLRCPEPLSLDELVTCAICDARKPLRTMSVGVGGTEGLYVLYCDTHPDEPQRFIQGWADLRAAQCQSVFLGEASNISPEPLTGLFVERLSLRNRSVSEAVARHLYTRQIDGVAGVVVDDPLSYASAVKKKWLHFVGEVDRARASTLIRARIAELTRERSRMARTTMRALPTSLAADVYFMRPDEAAECRLPFHTLYVISMVEATELHQMTRAMPDGSVVVRC